jgi:nucleotide-binding universal stress UspA family protein
VTIEILYKDRGKSVAWLVTDYARRHDTDLIVIGIRGQSKFKQFLEGNVANGVISNSSCPVLVVPR